MAKYWMTRIFLLALGLLTICAAGVDGAEPKKKTSSASAAKRPVAKPKTTPTPRPIVRGRFHQLQEGELPLAARGAIVIDAYTGQPLYEKNADTLQYPASTTKILTGLLVIEAGNLDQEVEITLEDSKVGESSLDVKPGQRFTRRQMLYGLLLKSANDVAHALGRDNAGSAAAFAERMTLRAQELGATSSRFQNAHGLHHPQHFTTPRDLAIITRAAMRQPLFREIVATREYKWVNADPKVPERVLNNHNRLLARFAGCTGVKTGYTNPAQQVLSSAAQWGTREVISVVMHTDRPGIWEDSMQLLSYGFSHWPGTPPLIFATPPIR